MCKQVYATVWFPSLPPLDCTMVNGDFSNESGDWQCTRIARVYIFDAIGRRYLADDSDGREASKEDTENLKDYINRNCQDYITSACESVIASRKVHPRYSP